MTRPCVATSDGVSCLMGLLLVATRAESIDPTACPVCGCPAAPVLPPGDLPRLPREETEQSGTWSCVICGAELPKGRRRYCSEAHQRIAELRRVHS